MPPPQSGWPRGGEISAENVPTCQLSMYKKS
jgi:hypothetical protein